MNKRAGAGSQKNWQSDKCFLFPPILSSVKTPCLKEHNQILPKFLKGFKMSLHWPLQPHTHFSLNCSWDLISSEREENKQAKRWKQPRGPWGCNNWDRNISNYTLGQNDLRLIRNENYPWAPVDCLCLGFIQRLRFSRILVFPGSGDTSTQVFGAAEEKGRSLWTLNTHQVEAVSWTNPPRIVSALPGNPCLAIVKTILTRAHCSGAAIWETKAGKCCRPSGALSLPLEMGTCGSLCPGDKLGHPRQGLQNGQWNILCKIFILWKLKLALKIFTYIQHIIDS